MFLKISGEAQLTGYSSPGLRGCGQRHGRVRPAAHVQLIPGSSTTFKAMSSFPDSDNAKHCFSFLNMSERALFLSRSFTRLATAKNRRIQRVRNPPPPTSKYKYCVAWRFIVFDLQLWRVGAVNRYASAIIHVSS